MNHTCGLIVLESRGEWAAALRRGLGPLSPTLREVRSVAECEAELAAARASFVVAELLGPNAAALVERIAAWGHRFPSARVAVVAARELAPWQEIALEAGAIQLTCSPRNLQPLLVAVARHVASVPQPSGSIADRIWAELPLSTHE